RAEDGDVVDIDFAVAAAIGGDDDAAAFIGAEGFDVDATRVVVDDVERAVADEDDGPCGAVAIGEADAFAAFDGVDDDAVAQDAIAERQVIDGQAAGDGDIDIAAADGHGLHEAIGGHGSDGVV